MLVIAYRDELGCVIEDIDTETVEFFEGYAYFNDKKIEIANVIRVCLKDEKLT
jgi:hypothetical protein